MKLNLFGPTSQQRSLPFNAERLVNMYVVLDAQGKEGAALYGTPGKVLFSSGGSGPVRAMFTAANGRCFYVSALGVYELTSAGVSTPVGTMTGSATSICSIAENGLQMAICNGSSVWIFTYATNVFAQVTDADLPTSGTISFIDGYFIVNKVSTGQFNISALYDGFTWGALDFATAESSPDSLLRVQNAFGQLWLFGEKTSEIWSNTGDSTFPFQRIAGAKVDTGILAAHTAITVDNSILWLGRDDIGSGIVYRAVGYTPKRISTEPIELLIAQATDNTNIRAYTYQQDGHVFYVLTGGGLPTSLVYDLTTQLWHERAFLESDGSYGLDIGNCCTYGFGYTLVGDRRNGNIYKLLMTAYDDNGDEILRERIFTHISNENKPTRYNSLEIGMETGVSLSSGQGSNALLMLQLSKDGARTWSDTYTAPIGALGKYTTTVRFRRLGIADMMTFRIKISDPIKVAITGAYLS